jgi:hypothetical protein
MESFLCLSQILLRLPIAI